MTEEAKKRMPAFPQELLDRPVPRGLSRSQENNAAAAAVVESAFERVRLLELLSVLRGQIEEAVGLIDAGRVPAARASLDKIDLSLLVKHPLNQDET